MVAINSNMRLLVPEVLILSSLSFQRQKAKAVKGPQIEFPKTFLWHLFSALQRTNGAPVFSGETFQQAMRATDWQLPARQLLFSSRITAKLLGTKDRAKDRAKEKKAKDAGQGATWAEPQCKGFRQVSAIHSLWSPFLRHAAVFFRFWTISESSQEVCQYLVCSRRTQADQHKRTG